MARAPKNPEARIRWLMDQAFTQLQALERDDAIFVLGALDGRISHERLRLTRGNGAELEEDAGEEPPPEAPTSPGEAPPAPESAADVIGV